MNCIDYDNDGLNIWTTQVAADSFRFRWIIQSFLDLPLNTCVPSPDFSDRWKIQVYLERVNNNLKLYYKSNMRIFADMTMMFIGSNDKIWAHKAENKYLYSLCPKEKILFLESGVDFVRYINMSETNTFTIDGIVTWSGSHEIDHRIISLVSIKEETYKKHFRFLFQSASYSDVTLRTEAETIVAHNSILCSRSPYFKQMFEKDMIEKNQNVVNITDINMPTLTRILEFMYTGDLAEKDLNLQEIYDIYYAADKYLMDDLKHKCGVWFVGRAEVDNATLILMWADRHNDEPLKKRMFGFIHAFFDSISQTEEWKSLVKSNAKIESDLFNYFTVDARKRKPN